MYFDYDTLFSNLKEFCDDASDLYWNAESFGSDLPDNWEEICETANTEIDARFQDVLAAREAYLRACEETGDEWSDRSRNAERELEDEVNAFIRWKDDHWDHIFWDNHPEYQE